MSIPLISVIIPAYNSAYYVTEAVDSVLDQTFTDLEILVIDDGSTDDTPQVMARYTSPVRYIRQPNSGVAAARNRGIAESQGRYIAFLDADDTWMPHKLERQVRTLDAVPGSSVCYSAFTVVDSDLRFLFNHHSQRQATVLEDLLMRGNVVGSICTVLCERALLEKAGGFDAALSQCADWDMWVRLAVQTEFVYLAEPLVTYRQHSASMSRNIPLLEKDSTRVLEKGFAMLELSAYMRDKRQTAFARNYMVLAGSYFQARLYRDFLRCAWRALALDFRQAHHLISYPLRVVSRLTHHHLKEVS